MTISATGSAMRTFRPGLHLHFGRGCAGRLLSRTGADGNPDLELRTARLSAWLPTSALLRYGRNELERTISRGTSEAVRLPSMVIGHLWLQRRLSKRILIGRGG
jgi:hypothetical protein